MSYAHNFAATMHHYFSAYAGAGANSRTFAGVTLAELPDIGLKFKVNINVYELVQEEDIEENSSRVVAKLV